MLLNILGDPKTAKAQHRDRPHRAASQRPKSRSASRRRRRRSEAESSPLIRKMRRKSSRPGSSAESQSWSGGDDVTIRSTSDRWSSASESFVQSIKKLFASWSCSLKLLTTVTKHVFVREKFPPAILHLQSQQTENFELIYFVSSRWTVQVLGEERLSVKVSVPVESIVE